MEEGQEVLCGELETVDTDLGFLFLIILAVLLSFLATVRERDGLWLRLRGEDEAARRVEDVTPLRLATSALVVGSLGFFFQQALDMGEKAGPDDPLAQRLAWLNIISGFLVLLAALIRLFALNLARRCQPSLAEALPPE